MSTKVAVLVSSLLFPILSACASGQSGRVAMPAGDSDAHVRLTADKAAVGDRVQLLRNTCELHQGKHQMCKDAPVAEGVVTQRIDGEYAVVRFPQGTDVREGDKVEPIR